MDADRHVSLGGRHRPILRRTPRAIGNGGGEPSTRSPLTLRHAPCLCHDLLVDDLAVKLREFGLGPLADRLGIVLVHASADRVVATMPVAGNTQPYGLLHGGASAALAETIGSIAAALHAGPERTAVGVDLSCTHHRGLRHGIVTGTATPISTGRTIACYDIRIIDEAGNPVCTARLTCVLRDARPPTSPGTESGPA